MDIENIYVHLYSEKVLMLMHVDVVLLRGELEAHSRYELCH